MATDFAAGQRHFLNQVKSMSAATIDCLLKSIPCVPDLSAETCRPYGRDHNQILPAKAGSNEEKDMQSTLIFPYSEAEHPWDRQ